MASLDVLAVGTIHRDDSGNVLEAHSTSTLIRSGSSNIVVDVSTRHMLPAIRSSLRSLGIHPNDVDTVVITHWHRDHTGNLGTFPNAEVYVWNDPSISHRKGSLNLISEEIRLCNDVMVVHTPGHTRDSISVFVEGQDRNYAVVGDAIPTESNYVKMVPPKINYDADVAMKSINTIASFADVIVPGHDFPFMTK